MKNIIPTQNYNGEGLWLPESSKLYIPAERFAKLGKFIADKGAEIVFGAGRLSNNYNAHFSVFSRGLQQVLFTDDEKPLYERWFAVAGAERMSLTDTKPDWQLKEALIAAEDPAITLITLLEEQRAVQYPDIRRETATRTKVFTAYDMFVAGVHIARSQPNDADIRLAKAA